VNPGIFLIQDNEELVEMNEQPYNSEKLLQTWLAKYPALLVGNQMNAKEPRRFLLIEQECGVPAKEQAMRSRRNGSHRARQTAKSAVR